MALVIISDPHTETSRQVVASAGVFRYAVHDALTKNPATITIANFL